MLPIPLLAFLAAHDLPSLIEWSRRARIPRQAVYQWRFGRGIADRHVRALARVVRRDPSEVRALLAPTPAATTRARLAG